MKVIIIPQDLAEAVDVIELKTPDWRGMRDAINGPTGTQCQYIERVTLPSAYPGTLVLPPAHHMIVDEEGLYHDEAKFNARATLFYPFSNGIQGTALIVEEGYTEDGPDVIDLRDPSDSLMKVNGFIIAAMHLLTGDFNEAYADQSETQKN